MPSSWISKSDGLEIRLAHPLNREGMPEGARERVYDLVNDVRFQGVDKVRIADVFKLLVQEDLTTRVLLRDLPDDEPTKTIDPAKEGFFWEGAGNNKKLVFRSTIVVSCVWNGERFVLRLRAAK